MTHPSVGVIDTYRRYVKGSRDVSGDIECDISKKGENGGLGGGGGTLRTLKIIYTATQNKYIQTIRGPFLFAMYVVLVMCRQHAKQYCQKRKLWLYGTLK